jgi:hypothetical protein
MLTKDKAAGLGTAAASRNDYAPHFTTPAATLLVRMSAEFSAIAEYRPLAMRAATPATSGGTR